MAGIVKAWELLNNKKTNIGATLMLGAMVLAQVSEIWGIDATWIHQAQETLEWAGGFIAGVGLGHKGVKTVTG